MIINSHKNDVHLGIDKTTDLALAKSKSPYDTFAEILHKRQLGHVAWVDKRHLAWLLLGLRPSLYRGEWINIHGRFIKVSSLKARTHHKYYIIPLITLDPAESYRIMRRAQIALSRSLRLYAEKGKFNLDINTYKVNTHGYAYPRRIMHEVYGSDIYKVRRFTNLDKAIMFLDYKIKDNPLYSWVKEWFML